MYILQLVGSLQLPVSKRATLAAMVKVLENRVVDLDIMPGEQGAKVKESVDGATYAAISCCAKMLFPLQDFLQPWA